MNLLPIIGQEEQETEARSRSTGYFHFSRFTVLHRLSKEKEQKVLTHDTLYNQR